MEELSSGNVTLPLIRSLVHNQLVFLLTDTSSSSLRRVEYLTEDDDVVNYLEFYTNQVSAFTSSGSFIGKMLH